MGQVSGNWLTGKHSGSACHHDSIYTKVNRKTGKCYSVKLCNPNSEWTEGQLSQRSNFGIISSALSTWIAENKESNSDAYKTVKAQYDRQTKYATLRGMMYAKGMATIQSGNTVQIAFGNYSTTVTVSSGSASGGTSSGGSSSSGSSSSSGDDSL